MNKVDAQEIAVIAENLALIAGVFSPTNAAAITLLLRAGTQLNLVLSRIAEQNDAELAATWTTVAAKHKKDVEAFKASVMVTREREAKVPKPI